MMSMPVPMTSSLGMDFDGMDVDGDEMSSNTSPRGIIYRDTDSIMFTPEPEETTVRRLADEYISEDTLREARRKWNNLPTKKGRVRRSIMGERIGHMSGRR
jgi:hypothetical protein